MDIRTRLALALVSISLLSMLVLGTVAYETAAALLREVSERQLDALAESKQRDLEKVIEGWRERVELIRSRTRLRELLALNAVEEDEAIREEMALILADARDSVQSVDRITIFDIQGQPLATAGSRDVAIGFEGSAVSRPNEVHYTETVMLDRGRVFIRFHAAMQFNERIVGAIEAVFDGDDLLSIAQDYSGLGESGETLIVMRSGGVASGQALALTPLRHDPNLHQLDLAKSPHLVSALGRGDEVFRSGIRDYRGENIWCATRALPGVNWGLIVKIDSAEESKRADLLRTQLIDLGLALGAIAILGGSLLGFWLGRPLLELKDIVERIRNGERGLRAEVKSSDEVGFLADALNDLLDELQAPR